VISDSLRTLLELSDATPAIVESFFSIGVATEDAMVSALAPLRLAVTTIVGKSTLGRALIGNCRYPTIPKIMMAAISSVVMTGRLMHSSDKFIDWPPRWRPRYIGDLLRIVAHDEKFSKTICRTLRLSNSDLFV
jgi:hypothetical protein